MINLIPNEEKKKIRRDFHFRFITVSFIMISICILVAVISILPSYFISNLRKNLANSKLEAQKNEQIPPLDQKAMNEIDELRKKIILIENSGKNQFSVTEEIFKRIISKKMSDININQIHYEVDPISKNKKMSINGIAPSRERLLLFRQTLEEDPYFTQVDLPISNFIKGSNIRFYLSLTAP
jgi:hypothetical protein